MVSRLLLLGAAALALPSATAHAQPRVGAFHAITLTSHAGELVPPSAGASTDSFVLPSGRQGEELELTGAAGPPVVTLTSPTGATIIPPPSRDGIHVDVRLLRPAGGTWVISLALGSPSVVGLTGAPVIYVPERATRRGAKRPRGTRSNRPLTPVRPPSGGRRT